MTDNAVVQGNFSDLKIVKTRSTVQIIIECPIEHGEQIIAAFGFPKPGEEIPVVVARLDVNAVKRPPAAPEKVKVPFKDMPMVTQAALRCNDVRFQNFLYVRYREQCDGAGLSTTEGQEIAASVVRWFCGVQSRKELGQYPTPTAKWKDLNANFEQFAGLIPEQR